MLEEMGETGSPRNGTATLTSSYKTFAAVHTDRSRLFWADRCEEWAQM